MKIIRWIVFLPLAFGLMLLVQLATAWVSLSTPIWLGVIIMLATSVFSIQATYVPIRICPNRFAGGALVFILLACSELPLFGQTGNWPTKVLVCRILLDLDLLIGIFAALEKPPASLKGAREVTH